MNYICNAAHSCQRQIMQSFNRAFLSLLSVWIVGQAFAQPLNDNCSSAIDLQIYVNQPGELAGPYSNVGATGNDLDIASVTGCWLDDLTGNADGSSPQIDATVWFRLDGYDGVLMVYIQPCDSNLTFLTEDTQMALYRGECDSLEIVACNEDVNSDLNVYWSGLTTEIESGSTYYLAVDGFNYSGFGSPELPLTTGEFCISLQEPVVGIEENVVQVISVYPNPTDGLITLQAESPIEEIVVTDLAGKKCRFMLNSAFTKSISFDMPMDGGIYLLHVKTEQGNYTHRIVRY